MLRTLYFPENRPYDEKEVVNLDGDDKLFSVRPRVLPQLPPVSEYSLESLLKAGVPLQVVNPAVLTSPTALAEYTVEEIVSKNDDKTSK